MAKFVFKLEGVLRQRVYAERECQRALAALRQQMSDLQEQLRMLNGSVQSANEDVRANHLTGKLDMNFLAAHRRYLVAVQRQGMELAQRMALLQRQVDTAQQALAEAAMQRKVIEKLRDKQLERWKSEESRKEMAALDEVAMQLSQPGR